MVDWTDFIPSVVGAVFGGASGGDKTQTATQNREPWGPAQPYMRANLGREAQLQNYYQKTPFNAQQARGYSNLFGDINNFHDNVAPGLLNFANNGMTSGYQRATGGAVGSGGGYGGSRVAGGLLQSGTGPFSVNKNAETTADALNYLNNTNNPFANGAIPQQTTAAAIPAAGGASGGLLGGNQGNYGHEGNATVNTGMPSEVTDVLGWNGFNFDSAKAALAAGAPAAVVSGLLGGVTLTPTLSQEAIDRELRNMAMAYAREQSDSGIGNGGYGGNTAGPGNNDGSRGGVNADN